VGLSFSADSEARLQLLLSRYAERRAALVPALAMACREFGHLSPEVMAYVAGRLDVPEADVLSAATFYSLLHRRPVGRHHVQVCVNVACYLKGADAVLEHLRRRLGIGPGEVTPDGTFSLEAVQCLASCGTAPAMQVGDRYFEEVTPERIDALIDSLRGTGGGGG
jgi:NADH-quinone oxidoreductase subunit E